MERGSTPIQMAESTKDHINTIKDMAMVNIHIQTNECLKACGLKDSNMEMELSLFHQVNHAEENGKKVRESNGLMVVPLTPPACSA